MILGVVNKIQVYLMLLLEHKTNMSNLDTHEND